MPTVRESEKDRLSPDQIAEKKRKAVGYTLKSRAKKDQEKKRAVRNSVEIIEQEFKERLRAIATKEVQEFAELRGLALTAIKDMLINGKDRERLTAANIVLTRTDPERKTVQLEVNIHPIDLTQFKLRSAMHKEQVIDVQCLPCPSVPTQVPT